MRRDVRTRHIGIAYQFVRERVESKELEVIYVPTDDMIADGLTKPINADKYGKHIAKMGLTTTSASGTLF